MTRFRHLIWMVVAAGALLLSAASQATRSRATPMSVTSPA